MKSIRGKLIFVYILIFLALASTVISSYIAIDTQKQHLILTELLSKQKLLIERVTFTTINAAETGLANQERFLEKNKEHEASLSTYKEGVDFMLRAFTNLEYPLDDKIVKLRFRGAFLPIFNEAIADSKLQWQKVKSEAEWLLNPQNLSNLSLYEQHLDEFRNMNKELITDADYLTQICRAEAERKKIISTWIQFISIAVSILIFLILVWFIANHFEKPIQQIRNVFSKMAKGQFEQSLERSEDDEFKALFQDFNRFVQSLLTIRKIEDHILAEDDLSKNLDFIQNSFKTFAPYDTLHLYFENTSGQKVCLMRKSGKTTYAEVENIAFFENVTQLDDQNIALPILVNEAYLGYVQFVSKKAFEETVISFLETLKDKLAFTFYKSLLFKDLLAIVTEGLADLAESRDPETRQHLIRMSSYAQLIAESLRKKSAYANVIDQGFLDNIKLTSPMHDIGKVAVPDHILLKPGKLTDEEYKVMKTHAYEGAVVLRSIHERFTRYNLTYFDMAAEIAHYHQEKFDGSGYPNGIQNSDIPLAARISALADVFDALTSKRPYKEAFSLDKSYNIIRNSRGTHFDPDIVDAFFEAQDEIEAIYAIYKEI